MDRPTIKPTPKQHKAWTVLKDKDTKYVIFGGGAGGGKAQPLDAKVYTPSGYKLMGDLSVGDKVLSSGGVTEVVAIHPQGKEGIYKLTFNDGAVTRVTKGHLWECWVSGKKRRRVRSTEELIQMYSSTNQKVIIPLTTATFDAQPVTIDPYVLGVMLGDGGLTKHLTLTSNDRQLVEEVDSRVSQSIRQTSGIQYSIVQDERNEKGYPINALADEFRAYGLLPVKCADRFVPEVYKYNTVEVRLEVLQGLLDTDGYIDTRGHVSFVSKSEQLAKDVQWLVRSLGGRASLNKVIKGCKEYSFVGGYYSVNITIDRVVFKLERKLARVKKFNGGVSEVGRRLVSIDYVGEEEAQCITVADESHLYLTDDFVLTHNSWLGCEWLLTNCYFYPNTKWFIGREELKKIMSSSFVTWGKVCKHHDIPMDYWSYNGQYNYIQFKNGSRIDFLDLKHQPSDPMYERLGSLEYTGGWIEEAGEVNFGAFDVLKSRINRHMNKEYGIRGKILMTCNPNKGWLYSTAYLPMKNGSLGPEYAFIQSLYTDNPHTADSYGDSLGDIRNEATKQRLMYGNWEYDEDASKLIEFDAINDMFTNKTPASRDRCLTIDIARYGRDLAVLMYWEGLQVKKVYTFERTSIDFLQRKAADICNEFHIPRSAVIADEDGVGGGFVDNFKCKGFVGNSKAIPNLMGDRYNFSNLRTQCYYLLADKINRRAIGINDDTHKEKIIQELDQVREKNVDKDQRLAIVSKDVIKEAIGRSPDFADTLMMRMWFELPGHGIAKKVNRKKLHISYDEFGRPTLGKKDDDWLKV